MDRRAFVRAALASVAAVFTGCATGRQGAAGGAAGTPATGAASADRRATTARPGASRSPPLPPGRTPTGAAATDVPLLCRGAWGARPATSGGRPHTVTGLMVHHTGVTLDDNRRVPARLAGYQRDHQRRGWVDVAYHLAVDRHGNVYELRDPAIAGDTATTYDPAGWLQVVADGNFDAQEPSDAQLGGLAAALVWGAARFGVDIATVTAHRDRAATACPGRALYRHVTDGSLVLRAQHLLGAGGVDLRRVCGQEAARRIAAIEVGSDAPLPASSPTA